MKTTRHEEIIEMMGTDPYAVADKYEAMEAVLNNMAKLTKSLHDSPMSLLAQMTEWADRYLSNK